MRTRARDCENCHMPVINSKGETVKNAMQLIMNKCSIYICTECCNTGKHITYEEFGYIQIRRKLLTKQDLLDFDDDYQS